MLVPIAARKLIGSPHDVMRVQPSIYGKTLPFATTTQRVYDTGGLNVVLLILPAVGIVALLFPMGANGV